MRIDFSPVSDGLTLTGSSLILRTTTIDSVGNIRNLGNLTVSGSTTLSGSSLTVTGSALINGSLIQNGTVRLGTSTTGAGIAFAYNASSGNILAGDYSAFTVNNHGDFLFASNLSVTGSRQLITNNNHATMRGAGIMLNGNGSTIDESTISFFAFGEGAATAGTISTYNSSSMVLRSNGLAVGFGKTFANGALDVLGNFYVSGSTFLSGSSVTITGSIFHLGTGSVNGQ